MVAVLTVFANHLWGWPTGGFVGVDVFFVISGFLITGNLLRSAESTGNVQFGRFYWARARRIIPAAIVVLVATYAASTLVFLPFRAQQVGIDALWAAFFGANWHFLAQDTDYFSSGDAVSPIQHYWSLSIEEQFYFVWPALIFVIGILVVRKSWNHRRRMVIAGVVMSFVVAASLVWALIETATSPAAAYFDTFARVWELGAGALLAISAGALARIPVRAKPLMSWIGLGCIFASLALLDDDVSGFPAPWALLPVVGAALVIAAGVGGEPQYQAFLRNPISGYIGDISYSLYLVHWPVIVLLGAVMDSGKYFSLAVLALAFALSVASYHFVEDPFRRADIEKLRAAAHEIAMGRYRPRRTNGYAAVAAAALLTLALVAFQQRPEAYKHSAPPPIAAAAANEVDPSGPELNVGPLGSALQEEIVTSLQATEWPPLDPPMEEVLKAGLVDPSIEPCVKDSPTLDLAACTFGSPTAAKRILLAGDSVSIGYAGPLRQIALSSNDELQITVLPMASCAFTKELIDRGTLTPNCDGRKRFVVDTINSTKPNVVIISNLYGLSKTVGSERNMTPGSWNDSLRGIIDEFRGNTGMVVLLASPPGEVDIKDCFGKRSNVPADCIGRVTKQWNDIANAEVQLAADVGGRWIDARPWFCSSGRLCPSFVGNTPSKYDEAHLAPPYGAKIYPVIAESLRAAGVLP